MKSHLTQYLPYFVHYWEMKKLLIASLKDCSFELNQLRSHTLQLLKNSKNPHKLMSKWEKEFDEAEKMFHHQGG